MFLKNQEKTNKSTNSTVEKSENKRDAKKRIKRARIAQNVIRYKEMLEDGICCMDDDLYSRAVKFTDINYQIATNEMKEQIIAMYSDFLQSLGNDVDVSLVINNRSLNKEEFEKNIIMPHKADGLDIIRAELNQRVRDNMELGNNAIVSEKMFTFTCKERNYLEAKKTLDLLAENFCDQLSNLGCEAEVMSGLERLETLASITFPARGFDFKYSDLSVGNSTKDFITPYSFDFKKNYFMMGERYCCTMIIQNYPTWLKDDLIYELSKIDANLVMTFHMQLQSKEDSIALINRTYEKVDMQIQAENEKNLARANFSGTLPPNLRSQSEAVNTWRKFVEDNDQRVFNCQFLVLVNAKSEDELNDITSLVERTGKKLTCDFIKMDYEQEIGFNCALPLGLPKEGLSRPLLTNNCAYIMPFTSQELLHENQPIFYGINKTTGNMILCNRKGLTNRNAFIMAPSGTGKSFIAKKEITPLFLGDPNANIIIIDPQGEYKKLVDGLNKYSKTNECQIIPVDPTSEFHFNPFDGDISRADFLSRKAEIAVVMMAQMVGVNGYLTGEQISLIDQIVHSMYLDYETALNEDPRNARMPTLRTFREYLKNHTGDVANQMYHSLWTYVQGINGLFAHESNVNINSRLVVFDIHEMSEMIKPLGNKVILETIKEQMLKNFEEGKDTWVYIDEIYRLLDNEYSENFLYEFWKWVRKFGGACTGITQNITDLLRSDKTSTMIANSDFFIMLHQEKLDLVQLKGLLNLSDEQCMYVSTCPKGSGLIRYGGTIVPFTDKFPKDTICYEMWNTDPEDKKKLEEKRIRKLQEESLRLQKEQREKEEHEAKMREVMMPAYAPKKMNEETSNQNNSKNMMNSVSSREDLCNVTSSNSLSESSQSSGLQLNPDDY